jgi:hypothetical protein
LLELGSNPNDEANGGSSALDMVLRNLNLFRIGSRFGSGVLTAVYGVRSVFDCLRALVSHGADWRPESGYGLNSLRRALERCEPEVTIESLRLGTPRMREHLKSQEDSLLRLGIHLDVR